MFETNYLAIFVAALISYIIGALWYSPLLFGNQWMKLVGKSQKDIDAAKKKGMGKTYFIHFLATLVMTWVLFYFIAGWYYSQEEMSGVAVGLQTGFWLWFGLFATTGMTGVLWEDKPWKLYFINTSYSLLSLLIIGIVIGMWL